MTLCSNTNSSQQCAHRLRLLFMHLMLTSMKAVVSHWLTSWHSQTWSPADTELTYALNRQVSTSLYDFGTRGLFLYNICKTMLYEHLSTVHEALSSIPSTKKNAIEPKDIMSYFESSNTEVISNDPSHFRTYLKIPRSTITSKPGFTSWVCSISVLFLKRSWGYRKQKSQK